MPTKLIEQYAKRIYQALPLSMAEKIRIKNSVFGLAGPFFRWLPAYQRWRTFQLGQVVPDSQNDESWGQDPTKRARTGLSKDQLNAYVNQILALPMKKKGYDLEHVARQPETWVAEKSSVKLIAYYLPQFHPIPENNLWWGKGFTEWTNVSKAVPQFIGHHQPHLPGELGFYDLRLPEVMRQQIDLAKQYGVYGFCFHYYWFGGKKLLERPLNQFLSDPTLDIPFCLCWANENWSRRWDGSEADVLMAQAYSPEDDIAFIDDLIPAFRDRRYITVDGRPLLIVYRVTLLPDAKATAARWRQRCREAGLPEPYLVTARSFDVVDPRPYGFDAAVEFPPHQVVVSEITGHLPVINPDYQGKIYDYREFVKAAAGDLKEEPFVNFKGVMPSWDNEARKPGRGHTFAYSSPAAYATWLRRVCDFTAKRANADERLVFVNAWNEWGEGAHLEPDRKYGYAYLHATANVLSEFNDRHELDGTIATINAHFRPQSKKAVVLHLFYDELFEEIAKNLAHLGDFDLFLTVRRGIKLERLHEIARTVSSIHVQALSNFGRDIRPFLNVLPSLCEHGYEYALKIHTKRSLHMKDGDQWRTNMLTSLAPNAAAVKRIEASFEQQPEIHLIAPERALVNLRDPDTNVLNRHWLDTLLKRLGRQDLIKSYDLLFPAGSMYWFRPETFRPVLDLGLTDLDFEPELGQLDGTLAHAIERLVGLSVIMSGGKLVDTTSLGEDKNPQIPQVQVN